MNPERIAASCRSLRFEIHDALLNAWPEIWQAYQKFDVERLPASESLTRKRLMQFVWTWLPQCQSLNEESLALGISDGLFFASTPNWKNVHRWDYHHDLVSAMRSCTAFYVERLRELSTQATDLWIEVQVLCFGDAVELAFERARASLGIHHDFQTQCFDHLWSQLAEYEASSGRFSSWCKKVFENRMLDLLKKASSHTLSLTTEDGGTLDLEQSRSSGCDVSPSVESSSVLSDRDWQTVGQWALRTRVRVILYHNLAERIPEAKLGQWKRWCQESGMDEQHIERATQNTIPGGLPQFLSDAWARSESTERQCLFRERHRVVMLDWFWNGKARKDPTLFRDTQLERLFQVADGRDRLTISCLSPAWHRIRLLNEFRELFGDCRLSKNFPWFRFTLAETPDFDARVAVGCKSPAQIENSPTALQKRWENTIQDRLEIEEAR